MIIHQLYVEPLSGFPFDDDRDENDATFRSQLDDIAARHPQFAHHLGTFPFRTPSRTRTHIPEEFTQHYTDRPFGDRFERFGFPFDDPLGEEDHKPYYQRYPQYYPQDQRQQDNQGESSCSGQESQNTNSEAHEESVDQEDTGRGRKLKNIQQSNTVDLGQRQEPVNDRNQRSMSAPPSNNRPRFVSSINIPVNQPTEDPNTVPNMSQASAPPQPQERVIPIHVEGRDEPIIPKRSTPATSQPQANPQSSQPYTDKFFTPKSPNFPQYFNRDQNYWIPKNFQNKQPQPQTGFSQNQRGKSPQPQPKPEATPQPTNIPEQPETQPKNVSSKPDPIDHIKSIQKDVSALMAEVDKFDGKPKDKKYLYLDEMLTRNLIKLDNIDTQGQENIRSARKEAIRCIEKCISILESKANSNVEKKHDNVEESKSKEMEVETTEEKEDTEKSEISNVQNIQECKEKEEESGNSPKEQMEVDTERIEKDAESVGQSTVKENTVVPEEKMETAELNKNNQENKETSNEINEHLDGQEKNDSNIQQETKSESSNTELGRTTEHKDQADKEKKKTKKKA
ncbi:BAG domain-containing protein Samui isoform X2 [Harmonia axyridis]|uniref:BAG domain-containing protein Samui isoform X2 n=1 Tax=Harmonia axyridis TaxID=115357 RepID=UPI001E275064|nr:BAG domain-containing protein Samui isoform X2 [Harmonia axyridis]